MTEPRTDKEAIYDEKIAPLMAQVIEICNDNKINMAMTFSLDFDEEEEETLFCTTVLPIDESDEEGMERIEEVRKILFPKPLFAAITIHSGN